jgi:hypothetical protein
LTRIRGIYLAKAYVESTNPSVVMPNLVAANVFPKNFSSPFGIFVNPISVTAPPVGSGYYSSIYVCGWRGSGSTICDISAGGAPATNVPLFAIEALLPVPDICITAVTKNSNPVTLPGLVDISINGTPIVAGGGTLPVSPATAVAKCAIYPASVSKVAVVDYVFRVSQ